MSYNKVKYNGRELAVRAACKMAGFQPTLCFAFQAASPGISCQDAFDSALEYARKYSEYADKDFAPVVIMDPKTGKDRTVYFRHACEMYGVVVEDVRKWHRDNCTEVDWGTAIIQYASLNKAPADPDKGPGEQADEKARLEAELSTKWEEANKILDSIRSYKVMTEQVNKEADSLAKEKDQLIEELARARKTIKKYEKKLAQDRQEVKDLLSKFPEKTRKALARKIKSGERLTVDDIKKLIKDQKKEGGKK